MTVYNKSSCYCNKFYTRSRRRQITLIAIVICGKTDMWGYRRWPILIKSLQSAVKTQDIHHRNFIFLYCYFKKSDSLSCELKWHPSQSALNSESRFRRRQIQNRNVHHRCKFKKMELVSRLLKRYWYQNAMHKLWNQPITY